MKLNYTRQLPLVAFLALFVSGLASATDITLDFTANPTLPSSQGFTYITATGTPESSAFFVGGGLLHQNTLGMHALAFYKLPNGFNATVDTTLEIRAQVYPGTTSAGFNVSMSDGPRGLDFYLDQNGIDLPDGVDHRRFVPFTTTDGFHTYKMVSTAALQTFNFYVDGVLLTTGIEEISGNTPSEFSFGDGTVIDDGRIDIAFIHYVNQSCQPPTITTLSTNPNVLWPPNHKMVPVAVSVQSNGGCGTTTCKITSVTSNEPVDADGDWIITGNLTLYLRAERQGNGSGRVYTITVQCTDTAGNVTSKATTVNVVHDQGH